MSRRCASNMKTNTEISPTEFLKLQCIGLIKLTAQVMDLGMKQYMSQFKRGWAVNSGMLQLTGLWTESQVLG
jgi:hypothetical protein